MFSFSAISISRFIPRKARVIFNKPSLKQMRWLPLIFFFIAMTFGLRLQDKGNLFFQEQEKKGKDFFSNISLFRGNSLKAAQGQNAVSGQSAAPGQKSPAAPSDEALSISIPQKHASQAPAPRAKETGKNDLHETTPGAPSPFPQEQAKNAPSMFPQTNQKSDTEKKSLDILNLTTEEVRILQSLSTRRREIERQEQAIGEREQMLTTLEKRLNQKIEELRRIQNSLKEMIAVREKQESEQLRGLVKIYELMKPEKAAEILSGLSAEVLLELLEGMKENKLAPILANMHPSIAQQITVELAARRKLTQQIQKVAQQKAPQSSPNNDKANNS